MDHSISRRGLLGVAGALAIGGTLAACGGTGTSGSEGGVTVYSADGLGDWYEKQFEQFRRTTGIEVALVESGSGEVVARAAKEISNPQVDLLVTLPPFIQRAADKDLLQPHGLDLPYLAPEDRDAGGLHATFVKNYFTMIRNARQRDRIRGWDDLLEDRLHRKVQYSTPGQSGDGTAMLLLLQHVMGKDRALDYVSRLEANNVGPSSSTGKLGPKVSTGELDVANSDLQMALAAVASDNMAYETFVPTHGGTATTISLPYTVGLAKNAPQPANARRLIEFLLSKDVQTDLPRDAFGLPARTDVQPTGPEMETIRRALDGVETFSPDWDAILLTFETDMKAYREAIAS